MDNNEVRERFIEEMGDVLMYYMDVLNRFNVTSEEFSKIYLNKYISNMDRNYEKQYKNFITNK